MLSQANTTYVIRYDFVLNSDISLPKNSTLLFDGGSIQANDSADTITGNDSNIIAEKTIIFK